MKQPKTILICPLDWGLGHATRDIPVARRLIAAGCRVVVAASPPLLELFREAIPGVELERFPGSRIRYNNKGSLILRLLLQLPGWVVWFYREREIVKNLVKTYRPDCIISDNRYGARHNMTKSIIITHQLMIKLPLAFRFMEYPVHKVIKMMVSAFDECWIPDNPHPNSLAGDLVHKYPLPSNAKLVGPLSRFMDKEVNSAALEKSKNDGNILVILSGPEPQKTILKNLLIRCLSTTGDKVTMICGEPGLVTPTSVNPGKNITLLPHLAQGALRQLIENSSMVICRAGYTSIMDLYYLNRAALLIPTPGQTEQEYLAHFNQQRHEVLQQGEASHKLVKRLKNNQLQSHMASQDYTLLQQAIDTITV